MKILRNLAKYTLLLIAIIVIVGFLLPSSSNVSRSVEINASSDRVFNYINDFQQFNRWSPWYGIDPDAQYQFEGPASGEGSKMIWSSDHPSVGKGSQEIIQSDLNKQVVTRLEFEGQGNAVATYQFEPNASGTRITWGFETDWGYNLIGRYMGLLMEKWVGDDYEKGLGQLKQLVESE